MSNVITTAIFASPEVLEAITVHGNVDFNLIVPMPDFGGDTIQEQHWAKNYWGVKANAKTLYLEDEYVVIQTDWTYPELWLNALSAQFPENEIIINYIDEIMEEYDGLVFLGGQCVEHYGLDDGDLALLHCYV